MRARVKEFREQPVMHRLASFLDRILPVPEAHARFVNTLSRMEYVGARKIAKSRRAERLDIEGLRHNLEELGHAVRLKKAALTIAPGVESVETYSDEHTLAGEEGEGYLQAIDREAERVVSDLPENEAVDCNYLLSSAAIEVRAEAFYPLYEERLRAHGSPFSVAAIQKDEERHLDEMQRGLESALLDWSARLDRILAVEPAALDRWIDALETAAAQFEKRGALSAQEL